MDHHRQVEGPLRRAGGLEEGIICGCKGATSMF